MKVSGTMKQRDRHHGQLEIGGRADGVAREHTQAATVGGDSRLQRDFHGEVGDLSLALQGAHDGGAKAVEPPLQDIVGGALFHHGGGRFLADGAGDHDEGNAQSPLLQQLERPQSAELRQGVVGQDYRGRFFEM